MPYSITYQIVKQKGQNSGKQSRNLSEIFAKAYNYSGRSLLEYEKVVN